MGGDRPPDDLVAIGPVPLDAPRSAAIPVTFTERGADHAPATDASDLPTLGRNPLAVSRLATSTPPLDAPATMTGPLAATTYDAARSGDGSVTGDGHPQLAYETFASEPTAHRAALQRTSVLSPPAPAHESGWSMSTRVTGSTPASQSTLLTRSAPVVSPGDAPSSRPPVRLGATGELPHSPMEVSGGGIRNTVALDGSGGALVAEQPVGSVAVMPVVARTATFGRAPAFDASSPVESVSAPSSLPEQHFVQRASVAAEVPESVASPAQAASVAPAGSATELGGAVHDDNEQLEKLAKKLYDKIRDGLKAELRLDRERWGRITDLAR